MSKNFLSFIIKFSMALCFDSLKYLLPYFWCSIDFVSFQTFCLLFPSRPFWNVYTFPRYWIFSLILSKLPFIVLLLWFLLKNQRDEIRRRTLIGPSWASPLQFLSFFCIHHIFTIYCNFMRHQEEHFQENISFYSSASNVGGKSNSFYDGAF